MPRVERRVTVVALLATLVMLVGGGVAWAAWTVDGSGSATGRAGALAAPTTGSVGTASCTSATTATLPVSFAPADRATGYRVQWSDSPAFTSPTTTTTTGTSTTLTITGAGTAKTVHVRVLSTLGAWVSGSSPVASAPVGPCGPTCTAGSTTVTASGDAWIDEADPTANHGSDPTLSVSSSNSGDQRALVQFDLPALPDGCTLTGATLQMYHASGTAGRTILAGRNTSSWTASTVTNDNRPTSSITDAGSSVSPSEPGTTQQWAVTPVVAAQYRGPNHGFVVRDQTENSSPAATQSYSSTEGGRPPQLVLTYG
ncbi:DNRLRE domain-containing protein [Pseudonocardia endophytica]|uniref:Fibronectin type-III domain-containing protein n=1 Tax=Pseudonocardia endophytica TaxID=401976 RepID=A0A4R1HJ54_PSEEN|nr:DNRLRE domain-containing protein [Pseudonocardia endophytica]TCK20923.1 hypothetical protein EV378_4889 [Pseudonocardia endophytica]